MIYNIVKQYKVIRHKKLRIGQHTKEKAGNWDLSRE